MLAALQNETKRQLQLFLDAKLVPNIILFEDESSDGFSMTENTTGHVRGMNDGKASAATVDLELCGHIPNGNLKSCVQLASFYKGEIEACNALITATGFSTAAVRHGLHSHGRYVQLKESLVHGPNPTSQTALTISSGTVCNYSAVIPAAILAQNAFELLTIMGFSAYPNPMTPTGTISSASIAATLSRLNATLAQLYGYALAYGLNTVGPFAGQPRRRARDRPFRGAAPAAADAYGDDVGAG